MDNTVFRQTAWQKEDNETYYLLKHSHTKNVCAQNYKYEDCDENYRRPNQVQSPNQWKVCIIFIKPTSF